MNTGAYILLTLCLGFTLAVDYRRVAVDPPVPRPPRIPRHIHHVPEQQCLFGCKPGDIIKKTDIDKVNKSLDDLTKIGMQGRKCAIGFVNLNDKTLENPRFYLKAGMMKTMPDFFLPKQRTVLLLFMKQNWAWEGTEGVMSYDINSTDLKVALMWSVPDNLDKGIKAFGKVYPKSRATDRNLYDEMRKHAFEADGVVRAHTEWDIGVEGVMYGANKAKLIFRMDTTPPPPPTTKPLSTTTKTTSTTPQPATTTKATTTNPQPTTTTKATTTNPKPTTTTIQN